MPNATSRNLWQSSMKTDCLHEKELPLEQMMPLIREQLSRRCSVRLSPRGTSMLPMLRQGRDSVVLSPLPARLQKYDLPLYRRPDGQYVLHRIAEVGDTYTCIGDNQFNYETGVSHDQMIAVVTSFTRGQRLHSVNELPYRLYCRIWHYSRPLRKFWHRVLRRILRIFKKILNFTHK